MLNRRSTLAASLAGLWSAAPQAQERPSLVLYSTPFPPMNYEEAGLATGWNVRVVREVLERAGMTARFEMLPRVRSVREARREAHAGLFPVVRLPERDAWFQWIGVISRPQNGFIVRADSPLLGAQSLNDFRGHRIGVVRDDVRMHWLEREGFKLGSELDVVPNVAMNFRKLLAGHIEAWPINLSVARYLAESNSPPVLHRLRLAWRIPSGAMGAGPWRGNWLALNLQAPADWVDRLRQAHALADKDGVMRRAQAVWERGWGAE